DLFLLDADALLESLARGCARQDPHTERRERDRSEQSADVIFHGLSPFNKQGVHYRITPNSLECKDLAEVNNVTNFQSPLPLPAQGDRCGPARDAIHAPWTRRNGCRPPGQPRAPARALFRPSNAK